MKKIVFLLTLFIASSVYAGDNSTSMTPIMSKAEELVNYIEGEMNFEIVRMEYDILRNTKVSTRYLSKGWTYMIVAFGDYRFKDIDVKVYRNEDGYWQVVAKDNDDSAVAVVSVEPEYDAEYKIEITAYSFEPGYDVGHYGLIVAHE